LPLLAPPDFAALAGTMRAWRRHLHAHPELGMQEHRTAQFVADRLAEFGCDEVATGLGETGVVAVIRGRGPGRSVALRADMDALPIEEPARFPYASRHAGRMHACGHDGHMAMLLGAARHLAERRDFDGRAVLVFQPDEERGRGVAAMLGDGLLRRFPFDRVFALHNWPGLEEGVAFGRVGPSMAAVAEIMVTFAARGGHAALPHLTPDAMLGAAQFQVAVQAMLSREVPAQESAVVSFGAIAGDGSWNVLPARTVLRGTARWFDRAVGELLERRVAEVARAVALGCGLGVEVAFRRLSPPVVNEAAAVAMAAAAAGALGGTGLADLDVPVATGDDMGVLLAEVPGCYLLLGAGPGAGLHTAGYDFNDSLLPLGAALLAGAARRALAA